MEEQYFITKSFSMDQETADQLDELAKAEDRPASSLIRRLIRQEYARHYSQPNPCITVGEAQAASVSVETVPGKNGNEG